MKLLTDYSQKIKVKELKHDVIYSLEQHLAAKLELMVT
jgi:hypothetical protein